MKRIISFCFLAVALVGVADQNSLQYKKTVQTRIAPSTISHPIVNRTLCDFGREAFGFLEFIPPPGTRGAYEVRLGELLKDDGSVNMRPGATIRAARIVGKIDHDGVYRVPLVADRRNTSGGQEGGAIKIPAEHGVIMPFRYAEIFYAPFAITSNTVRMVAIHYPMNMQESEFTCDDENLVKIYDLCKYSIWATSFAGIYVDGDRERIPYEADAYLNQLGEYAVHSDYSLARASHEYLMKHPTWPTEWKQHSIKMAWADWMWTGDTQSIEKFYDALKNEKLLEKFCRADGLLLTGGERGSKTVVPGAADIVDWPLGERDGFVFRPVNAVVNAFYYRNLLEMADIAHALNKLEDEVGFRARAKKVYEQYQKVFFNQKLGYYCDGEGTDHASLHANAAALAFGLVPRTKIRGVVDFCANRGMACSVYFAQYLLEAFYEAGRPDLGYKAMTCGGERSWMNMFKLGATVTLEAWSPKYKGNLDMNHAWGAAPLNIISRYVLGVTPLEAGFAKIRIAPQVGNLQYVKGKVPTAKGVVKVEVISNALLRVETPAPAQIEFAGQVRNVEAGKYEIKILDAALNPVANWQPACRWRGFNLLEMFIKGWNDNDREFKEADFKMIHDWGFNFVRLPMDYRLWIEGEDWEKFDEKRLQIIDRAVNMGKKYGVHVCICMHRAPGYTVATPQEGTDLFKDPKTQQVCAKHWAMFARRYKGIPNENLSFNLFNEPPKVEDAEYGHVAKILIEAIRREDPTRFIIADGLSWGSNPANSLVGIPGVGQATRGYFPMSISHYMASWVGTPTETPIWPILNDTPNGILAGVGKPELRGSFKINDLPPCKVKVAYGRVSSLVKVRFQADGKTVAEVALNPKPNAPQWHDVQWYPQWKIFQGGYSGITTIDLPQGAKQFSFQLAEGDWAYVTSLTFTSLTDANKQVVLPIVSGWNVPENAEQQFLGFSASPVFRSLAQVKEKPRYDDPGMNYLYNKLLKPWDTLIYQQNQFVMAGEFGCYKFTPHALVLDWLEDYLRLWKERNMGWAMWNLRGEIGILDSNRKDVEYEDFQGHKLDRKMLDLLLKY